MTLSLASRTLSLRAAATDGGVALLATRELSPEDTTSAADRRYQGPVAEPSFPRLGPYWRNATVSGNGRWVLWKDADESWQLFDAHDGRAIVLPHTRYENEFAWSPDGESFAAVEYDTCTLQVVTPGAARATQLASLGDHCTGTGSSLEFWFSPDGSQVAYLLHRPVHAPTAFWSGELYVVNADGTNHRMIAPRAQACRAGNYADAHYEAAPWSPDGTKLSFATLTPEQPEQLATVEFQIAPLDGSLSKVVLEVPLANYSPNASSTCEWSPRGDRVLIAAPAAPAGEPPQYHYSVYSVSAQGTDVRTLAGPSFYIGFQPSPNGEWLSLYENQPPAHSLTIMRHDGSERRLLSATSGTDSYLSELRWSPDGTHTLHSRTFSNQQESELQLSDVATAGVNVIHDGGIYSWTPDGKRALYASDWWGDQIGSVLANGSDEKTFSVSGFSLQDLVWLRGGEYWGGVDESGLWIQKFGAPERAYAWTNRACEALLDYASWDHDRVL